MIRFLTSGITITVVLSLILSALIWFFGAFLGFGDARPLDGALARGVTIAVLWLIALAIILLIVLRRAKQDKAIVQDIVAPPQAIEADPGDEAVQAELGDLRGKLKLATTKLRKSRWGRSQLYDLPWYMIIGPPGAGKTTALINSGLDFPLADDLGQNAIGGVGGTRNCDWWFTDQAVIIDTAGRYTTQDSDADADNAAWLGFLGMLKKHRPRQPINGAMIAISLSDLSMQDETTQRNHANAIRRRLQELRSTLGVRFPVYVLFTKADLIAGFSEFFENMGREGREQVWGFTLPLDKKGGEASPVASFDQEFAGLLERLNGQSLDRMEAETDPQRRSLIAGFPGQVASARQTARDFLTEVFKDSRFEQRQLLRGVYFTSGTQEGTPIDRLMMGMARTFGIGRQAIGSGRGSGKSFFITDLFERVMFPEAGLVSADDKVERRYRWTMRGAVAAAIVATIGFGALWTRSYLGNQDLLAQSQTQILNYRAAAAEIPGSPISDSDLPGVVPALNILRNMPGNPAITTEGPPAKLTWGLYQGEVIGTQSAQAYRASLNQQFLPRLILRLEEQMQANMDNANLLYEALKVYLMLGLEGPMNSDFVTEWMTLDWSISFPGDDRAGLQKDLGAHLDVLLRQPMDKIELNGPLVEQVQGILSELPLAQRVYKGIINSPRATELPEWRLTDAGGGAVNRAFQRSSGKSLNEGIPGIYTYAGFNDVFLDEALGVASRIQRESWVLGPRGEAEQSEATLLRLSREVLELYYDDYVSEYDQLLADLDVVPLQSLSHAVEVTNILSNDRSSPMLRILKAIASETQLTEDRSTPANQAAEGAAAVGGVAAQIAQQSLNSRKRLFVDALRKSAGASAGAEPEQPGAYVEERFSWLHQLVGQNPDEPAPLDTFMATLTEVYQELNKQSFSGQTATQGTSAIVQLREVAARLEGPMQRWAAQITSGSSGIAADGTRASINAAWQANVLPFCTQALSGRYPFDRRAKADVAMADFSRLFAPGGLIDGFFNENLIKLVDVRAQPWAWKELNDTDLGMSPTALKQFQNAAAIRDAFFGGAAAPLVNFQLTPEALDPNAKTVTLEIDGQTVEFNHRMSAPKPTAVTWPGSVGVARVVFQPPDGKSANAITRDGPWAWLRLLNAAELRKTNVSDRSRVIFRVGGRIAIYNMQSGSILNPFALKALSDFKCPESL
ncbi:MAG: type VI secretion system membrane subunit TssM [Pseudomonadota bacterium]